jgi:hypothetical protein
MYGSQDAAAQVTLGQGRMNLLDGPQEALWWSKESSYAFFTYIQGLCEMFAARIAPKMQ